MAGQTDRQTDGQTDVGHINLIGGLVTRNLPKNVDKQMDGQTDEKRTNERTEFHQFRKEPSYDGDLSPCQV